MLSTRVVNFLVIGGAVGVVASFWGSCGLDAGLLEDSSGSTPQNQTLESITSCDVVVAGGSTAALFAALTAAREGVSTCLLEPTNWPGGQLTASGVPAVDFAWHKLGELDVAKLGKDPRNIPKEFHQWMVRLGNPGGCWVSRNCFEPKALLIDSIHPTLASQGSLQVFRDTVIKSVGTRQTQDGTQITEIVAIQRLPKEAANQGYDRFLSQDLAEWYSPQPSQRFDKKVLTLRQRQDTFPLILIDATEWGEVLALSGADYLIGAERQEDTLESQPQCGQATVFPFVIDMVSQVEDAAADRAGDVVAEHPGFYGLGTHGWSKIWTYRRIKGSGDPGVGQASLQNWNPGNDYPFRYLFKDRAATAAEVASDWQGGIDLQALAGAERHALGWYQYYRDQAPAAFKGKLRLNRTILGTSHGLSKVPYIRDTRRSVGLDGFVIRISDLTGSGREGTKFTDRIGLGAYAVDIHPTFGTAGAQSCTFPPHAEKTLPFYLPLRAHTNRSVSNLLVAGKTMAQTFLANAAIRLHPIEASSGIGAGAAAAVMVKGQLSTTRDLLSETKAVQSSVLRHGPIDWNF